MLRIHKTNKREENKKSCILEYNTCYLKNNARIVYTILRKLDEIYLISRVFLNRKIFFLVSDFVTYYTVGKVS